MGIRKSSSTSKTEGDRRLDAAKQVYSPGTGAGAVCNLGVLGVAAAMTVSGVFSTPANAADPVALSSPTRDLGTLGGTSSRATQISADGRVVVGWSPLESGEPRTFRWTEANGMQDLGNLGGVGTFVHAVSTDGSVIVGEDVGAIFPSRAAFRWTEANGMENLGTLGGTYSQAFAVSADGSVIVGSSWLANDDNHAFRWTETTGMQDLGTLGGDYADASAVSANGKVIVGQSELASGNTHAYRWTEAKAMQDLGTLGGSFSQAFAVSADGSVVIGNSALASGFQRAFRWTEANAMQDLGTLGGDNSSAETVSANGIAIIGSSELASGAFHAFRWTAANAMQDLGTLGGNTSSANAISADGSVIVGKSTLASGFDHAFRWTETTAMQDLGTLGGNTSSANAISADGSVIVGSADTASGETHAALWKFAPVNPPEPGGPDPESPKPGVPTLIDVDNTIRTVASAAHETFSVMEMQRMGLARLQDSCDVARAGETCYSARTDIRGFDGNTDVLARINLAHAFTDNVSAGVSVAHSFWRDLPASLSDNDSNIGGGIHAQWRTPTPDGSWYLRGALSANRYDLERTRRVLPFTEAGTGDSAIKGWGASLEVGRAHELSERDGFSYYGGLRYSNLKMDGYAERNAAFPFTYSDTALKQTTGYIGATYNRAVTGKVAWSIDGRVEQDLAHDDPDVMASAAYIGALIFDADLAHTRASLSSTVSYAVTDNVKIDVTPYIASTSTRDAAWGAAIGISGKF
ncbi:Outer membrane autotransporter barrel domain-containing protein [Agrobacterium salinitolerans str. Hayward 0363]|nr:Outer membrane autotransporter barrel domain-containing protein [Agrobacterium salinitolerans str. Hayward 0363]